MLTSGYFSASCGLGGFREKLFWRFKRKSPGLPHRSWKGGPAYGPLAGQVPVAFRPAYGAARMDERPVTYPLLLPQQHHVAGSRPLRIHQPSVARPVERINVARVAGRDRPPGEPSSG